MLARTCWRAFLHARTCARIVKIFPVCNAMLLPFVYGRGANPTNEGERMIVVAPPSASVRHRFPVGVLVCLRKVLAKHDNMSEETMSRNANNAFQAIRRHRADV